MMTEQQTPYANLNPDLMLDAVESVGFHCSGSFLALNSYENRVYQIGLDDAQPIVAKFYRPGRWSDDTILEEHQFAHELMAQEIPVVAPWLNQVGESLHSYQDFRFALFPRHGGRAFEFDNSEQLEWMGRFIGRLHAVGSTRNFESRLKLDLQTYGTNSYRFLIDQKFVPDYLQERYCQIVEALLERVQALFDYVGSIRYIRVHGDMHVGNVLWRDEGPHIVDLDDCIMAPAVQDIWMLLSGDEAQATAQLEKLLQGYHDFYDFDYRELRLIEAFRTLRQLFHSAWLARRWQDPAFPLAFPWFDTPGYWQEQIKNLQEQIYILDKVLE